MHDYLEALSRCQKDQNDEHAKYDLMRAFAELQFCIHGGAKCSVCHAHVRHVLAITSERADGTRHNFDCLCNRCFESERAAAKKIAVSLGDATIYFDAIGERAITEPHPRDLRRH
jgi:bacterioferritin-associated ferredoxin